MAKLTRIFFYLIFLATNLYKSGFAAEVHNHVAPGNLESTVLVDCVSLEKLNNKMTPADLFPAVIKCINSNHYSLAAPMFLLAGSYGYFDKLRVTDVSAHEAIPALLIQIHDQSTTSQITKFGKALDPYLNPQGNELANVCVEIRKIGPPNYYPTYMIQHGMGAFLPKSNEQPIKGHFDADKAWEDTLNNYLHCPKALNPSSSQK